MSLKLSSIFHTKAGATPYEALIGRVYLEFATRSQNVEHVSAETCRTVPEPVVAVEKAFIGGHKSLIKIGIPMVQITGIVRTSLREIYERVPHVSAASASAELLKKHTSNNMVVSQVLHMSVHDIDCNEFYCPL